MRDYGPLHRAFHLFPHQRVVLFLWHFPGLPPAAVNGCLCPMLPGLSSDTVKGTRDRLVI